MGNMLSRLVSKTHGWGGGRRGKSEASGGGWEDYSGAYAVPFLSNAYKDVGVPSAG